MSQPSLFERGASGLEGAAGKLRKRGGAAERVAPLLEDDADFLRRIEPRLVAQRIRGGSAAPEPRRPAPPPAETDGAPAQDGSRHPDLIRLAAALAAGIAAAQLVTWRSYVEPRR